MAKGTRESQDFGKAMSHVDLIRNLTFDGRAGTRITFPLQNENLALGISGRGTYSGAGYTGDRIQFWTQTVTDLNTGASREDLITWESRRKSATSVDEIFTVYRWVQQGPLGTPFLSYSEGGVNLFETTRKANNVFNVKMAAKAGKERLTVDLTITLRNVLD